MLMTLDHDTPVGRLTLVGGDDGLRAVLWPDDRPGRVRLPETRQGSHPTLAAAADQLDEYFAGDRRRFELTLDVVGTDFQQTVWTTLRTIDFGEASTYAKQAAAIGRPTAVRAVASAIGRNPLSIVVPCHRVVGSDGSLTGFAGGLDAKTHLLDHERAVASP